MASLKFVYNHRYIILVWSTFEILLFAAIVYGWASLVIVLKQEDFFRDLCEYQGNSTIGECSRQDERLNLVFLTGAVSFSATGFLSGIFLDRFGPRKARLLSSCLFGLSFLCFVLADKDRPNLIFPGIATLSSAGITLLFTNFQVSNMFDKWQASVVSVFNGAVDSSAIVLLFFKLVYDAGFPLRSIIIFYYLCAIISIPILTFVLPPYMISAKRLLSLNGIGDSGGSSHVVANKYADGEGTKIEGTCIDVEFMVTKGFIEINGNNIEKDDVLNQNIDVQCQEVKSVKPCSREDSAPKLIDVMLTVEYILPVLFLTVCNLRLWFYVGSLNSYLEFKSENDLDIVNHYTNWFGILQFAGFVFAPFVGLVMDWKPKKKRNVKTDSGFVFGFFLTSVVALILNILVLVPVLSVQYASFVFQVVLRAFVYAVYTAFILHKFPLVHFGTLNGAGHLIASLLGAVQYGLVAVTEEVLMKDPFWVNVGLLVLCLFLNVLPAQLWFKERELEKTNKAGIESKTKITPDAGFCPGSVASHDNWACNADEPEIK